jgi:hypothetical protein
MHGNSWLRRPATVWVLVGLVLLLAAAVIPLSLKARQNPIAAAGPQITSAMAFAAVGLVVGLSDLTKIQPRKPAASSGSKPTATKSLALLTMRRRSTRWPRATSVSAGQRPPSQRRPCWPL